MPAGGARRAGNPGAGQEPCNVSPVAVYYLSQADLGRELGISSEAVRLLRMRYPAGSAHPFPEPDSWTGVDEVEETEDGIVVRPPSDARENPRGNARSVPGWLPSKVPDVKAWRAGLPGSGKGGGRPRRVTPS